LQGEKNWKSWNKIFLLSAAQMHYKRGID